MKNTKKGFTIVELVIVIAVIAVLAGVLIPTFTSITNKAKKSAALQEATAAYTVVLAEEDGALKEGYNYYFSISKEGKDYWYAIESGKLVAKENNSDINTIKNSIFTKDAQGSLTTTLITGVIDFASEDFNANTKVYKVPTV